MEYCACTFVILDPHADLAGCISENACAVKAGSLKALKSKQTLTLLKANYYESS